MKHSTELLLSFALSMLDEAAKEQSSSRRRDKWLQNNMTLDAIRERVRELTKEGKILS